LVGFGFGFVVQELVVLRRQNYYVFNGDETSIIGATALLPFIVVKMVVVVYYD